MLTVLIALVVGLPCLFLTVGFTQLVAFPAVMKTIKKMV